MPYPFVLPTTSAFSFSDAFTSDSHPSLPLSASTQRGVVRDALKRHRKLDARAQTSHLAVVTAAVESYLPYLVTVVEAGGQRQRRQRPRGAIRIAPRSSPPLRIEWRPTLSTTDDVVAAIPGRRRRRRQPPVVVCDLAHELAFVLSSLAFARVAAARDLLRPLHSTTGELLGAAERVAAITAATRHLLDVASMFDYLARRDDADADADDGAPIRGPSSPQSSSAPTMPGDGRKQAPPCVDVSAGMCRALASLALAEATLLAVLKDDPYPAAAAQARNARDTEWMYKAPDMPRVRAHLFARLALAAGEHAARALALCRADGGEGQQRRGVSPQLIRYVEDLRRVSRARACRFFGIDAEIGGETADGIGWVRAGLQELGVDGASRERGGGSKLGRLRRELRERREDRRVDGDGEAAWGADAGVLEETRILELLDMKWSRINDAINTKIIPPPAALLSKMPTGRDIHTIKPYTPPTLDRDALEAVKAAPARQDDWQGDLSSDDDDDDESAGGAYPPGSYPASADDSGGRATGSLYY